MQTIHQLPPELVAKIGAGEVVERPAYALKELLDNAIDAQATEISIEIEESGLKKIAVSDNGSGMSKEDLRESFKPHTTSKLHSIEDLHTIHQFGFRGEALWSIASISDLSIKSRELGSDNGHVAELKGGHLEALSAIGMPFGSVVEINNLFNNIPARKKFMRSAQSELRHLLEVVTATSLAFPTIGIQVKHNNKIHYNLPKNQSLLERTLQLFGHELQSSLINLEHDQQYISLHGFITKPQAAIQSSLKQYLFVNNRRIYDKIIASTIKEAYGTLLEPRMQPAFIIFLQIPPERIDVNIHPRKEQIAFAELSLVTKAVYEALTTTLTRHNLIYQDARWKKGEYSNHKPSTFLLREGGTTGYAAKLLKNQVEPWSVNNATEILKTSDIIQVHNTFIITQTKNGLIMIDQHAAHERILFEQFLAEFQNEFSKKNTLDLEKPQTISLGIQGYTLLTDSQSELEKIGFKMEPLPGNQFIIKTIPLLYKDKDITRLILEIVDELIQEKTPRLVDSQSHKMLSYLACRTAIKAGDKLTKEQAKNLLEKLQQTNTQYTCPHGRPVQVELSLYELYRIFHRV
jgi:DNA mismatch repair protein MutL